MIVQFSINPMDSEHINQDIQKVIRLLEKKAVKFVCGPMGTTIQGSWAEIMPIIQECHQLVASDHARVMTSIVIDDHKGKEHNIGDAVIHN